MSNIIRFIVEIEGTPEDFRVGHFYSFLASKIGESLGDTCWEYKIKTEIVENEGGL